MTYSPRNFSDKALWLSPAATINTINVSTLGEASTILSGIFYGSQDDLGKRVELVKGDFGAPYHALYQLVQVDSGATAANVANGRAAFVKYSATAGVWTVTSEDQADAASLFAGMFLNSITPVNYGAIAVGGIAAALFAGTVTNVGTLAIGDVIGVGKGAGAVDDLGAGTIALTGRAIGIAIAAAPAVSTISPIRLLTISFN